MQRRRRPPTWLLVVVLTVAGIWFVAVAITAVRAAAEADTAQSKIDVARRSLLDTSRDPKRITELLDEAREHLASGRRLTHSAVMVPARVIPGLRRQIVSFDALSAAAVDVSRIADEVAPRLPAVHSVGGPADRVKLLDRFAKVATTVRPLLAKIDLGPRGWLVPPLAQRRASFAADLERLRRATVVAPRLRDLLKGPRRYLLLAANNAEMRSGSGMFLSAGTLTIRDGRFSVSQMRSTTQMRVGAGRVKVPPDLERLWGWMHPTQEWRNLATTPRFDVTGPLAAKMWKATGQSDVDGVIAVDAIALASVVAQTGDIDVEGKSLRSSDVVKTILHDQYIGASLDDFGKAVRRDRLAQIASASAGAVDRGGWDPVGMSSAIASAASGRHLLAWSSHAHEEQMWAAAGLAGRMRSDAMMLSVLNRNGTKLDQFLKIDATLDHDGEHGRLTVRLSNTTPEGEPPYVTGPHPNAHAVAGEYQGLLTLSLPGRATNVRADNVRRLSVGGRDGDTLVAAVPVDLKRGGSTKVVFRFDLAKTRAIVVEPSARYPAITWHSGSKTWHERLSERIPW